MPRKKKPAKTPLESVADSLTTPVPRVPVVRDEDLLSTGCTLLNVAFSGRPHGGVPKGNYVYYVGESGSSKTWLILTAFAEAIRNPHFKDYRLVFDNAENGALMELEEFFGPGLRDRLEPPRVVNGRHENSDTVQQFYLNVSANCKKGPCIYALDSMDALNDDADDARFAAEMKRFETGKGDVPGSMGMAKAKTNSKNINRVVQDLRDNGSVLIVISQVRDKVNSQFPGMKTRGGGRALRFYAHLEAWTSVCGVLTKDHNKKEREIGSRIRVDVQKNRVSGWEGKFEFDFLKGYGVDDVGSCVDWLVEEGHWEKSDGGLITADDLDIKGRRETLVRLIETGNHEAELGRIVGRVWKEIKDAVRPQRKPRYT